VNHHVELFNTCSECFNCGIITHVQVFVSNTRIGPVFWGCDVGNDDICAVIEKGFRQGAADPTGTAGDQNMFSYYAEIRHCHHIVIYRESQKQQ
jgi:hypothetical protein